MSAPQLSKFEQMKASGDLPSPKGVALSVMRLTQRDDASIAELVQVARTDPAFVERLIKTANSCNLGAGRQITSIQEAITVLGMPVVRGLALGFSLISAYRNGSCHSFDYSRFWTQSLVRAIALQALASRLQFMPAEEAFSFGLLSNVGELALATLYPEAFSRLLGEMEGLSREERLQRERDAFMLDSAGLTAALLEDWGFPKSLVSLVLLLEKAEQAPYEEGSKQARTLQAILMAGQIADVCVADESQRRALMPQLYLFGGRLSLDASDVMSLSDEVVIEWHKWGELLQVETGTLPPFEELTRIPPPPKVISPKDLGQLPLAEMQSMRVLIVDDDASMRAILSAVLSKSGHEVFVAANGRQAFEMALELRPQIMVVDWMMPEMDGLELAVALRQTRIGRAVYLILLTGIEDEAKLIQAFEAGADDFLTKPLKPRVLEARLRSAQRVVQLQQEIERDRADIQRFAAELAVTNRRLQDMAQTDALTGLPNRRYAIERMAQEWAEAKRSGRALSCMVVDIDGFKGINDTHGHDIGDAALKAASAAMKDALRAHDVVCRTGGDEFVVICPDTTLAAAMRCGERIRAAVSRVRLALPGDPLSVAVSIGVAERTDAIANPDALIKTADQGLYQAKTQGRNQCTSAQMPVGK